MASALMRRAQSYCKCRESVVKFRQTGKTITGKPLSSHAGVETVDVTLGNKEDVQISTGKLAKLADGCALVTYQGTTVIATVVSKDTGRGKEGFVPLTVSYQQKAAALGLIPLNFLRREVGQTEHEVITSRMIDRSIRPLFPKDFNWETQIICSPLAVDGTNFPDVLAINAASAALAISDVPWNGPVGAVRVGLIDDCPIVNPTKRELTDSQLNLIVTCRESKLVTMIEGNGANVNQSSLLGCISTGVKECRKIALGIANLRNKVGKEKRTFKTVPVNPEIVSAVESLSVEKLKTIFEDHSHDKTSRDKAIFDLRAEVVEKVKGDFAEESPSVIYHVYNDTCKQVFRDSIFEKEIRCDGRSLSELRQMQGEVDLYRPLHGSAMFQRGQTQVLCTVALDSPNSALKSDKISMLTSGLKEKNFFVHYEFPPFATNETGRVGPIGRREIGHGLLAERALQSNIPDNFPFTIRLTSEVLESNGSSSMATVCGGTLALLDAGVPLKDYCAGVAMGLLTRCDENGEIRNYKVLTDLLGIEDYLGEMDFKVAGTTKTFTALQLDVKNDGVPQVIIFEILGRAKNAISEIVKNLRNAIPKVRSERKDSWPERKTLNVPVHLRPKLIGPGGINVKRLEMTTGVELTEDLVGEFTLFAPNKDAMKEASDIIAELMKAADQLNLEFGAVYTAVITQVKDTGCMVQLHPDMKPVHVPLSQLDVRQVQHPSALGLQTGQEIKVKYFGRDPMSGAMRLSRKVLLGPASEVAKKLHKPDSQLPEELNVATGKENS